MIPVPLAFRTDVLPTVIVWPLLLTPERIEEKRGDPPEPPPGCQLTKPLGLVLRTVVTFAGPGAICPGETIALPPGLQAIEPSTMFTLTGVAETGMYQYRCEVMPEREATTL